MRTLLLLPLLSILAVLAGAVRADDDDDAKAKTRSKLTTVGQLSGKITDISSDGRKFVI